MSKYKFLTFKSNRKFDGVAIKFDGTKEQISYIKDVLDIPKYRLKHIQIGEWIFTLDGEIKICSENEFKFLNTLVGDIENPEGVNETPV